MRVVGWLGGNGGGVGLSEWVYMARRVALGMVTSRIDGDDALIRSTLANTKNAVRRLPWDIG